MKEYGLKFALICHYIGLPLGYFGLIIVYIHAIYTYQLQSLEIACNVALLIIIGLMGIFYPLIKKELVKGVGD